MAKSHPIAFGFEVLEIFKEDFSSSPKLTKGNLTSIEDIGAEFNFVITPNTDDYLIRKDIRVCSLEVFLEKYI